jgi:hypothetical protein
LIEIYFPVRIGSPTAAFLRATASGPTAPRSNERKRLPKANYDMDIEFIVEPGPIDAPAPSHALERTAPAETPAALSSHDAAAVLRKLRQKNRATNKPLPRARSPDQVRAPLRRSRIAIAPPLRMRRVPACPP